MLYPEQVQEKQNIRRRSNLAGFALLLTVVLSLGASVVIAVLRGRGVGFGMDTQTVDGVLVATQPNAYLITNTIYYLVAIGVPMLVGCTLLRSTGDSMSVRRSVSGSLWIGYLLFGMGMCVFANLVASATGAVFSVFSLYPAEMPLTTDGTWQNALLSVFSLAVLPAIFEEILFRGVVVTLLRPAGERVAIALSAMVFALAHGSLTQIPFAWILGVVFAYLYLRTGNLLLTMTLHFLNNTMAVLLEVATLSASEQQQATVFYVVFAVLALLGAVAAAFLRMHADHPLQAMGNSPSVLPDRERKKAAWLSPVVIVFILASLLMLPLNVEYDPDRSTETSVSEEQEESGLPWFDGDGNESAVITWR